MKNLTVRVTQACIERGRLSTTACPVALALEATLGRGVAVSRYYPLSPSFYFTGGDRRYRLSSRVSRYIAKWDETGFMEPFDFILTSYPAKPSQEDEDGRHS